MAKTIQNAASEDQPTHNAIRDLARKILKEKETQIQVLQAGPDQDSQFSLILKFPDVQSLVGMEPVKDALKVFADGMNPLLIQYDQTRHGKVISVKPITSQFHADFKDDSTWRAQPVLGLARALADAGINFPGSARFKTPEKGKS